jgi:putative FmdB family regulatory protein
MPTYEYRCPEGHLFEKFQRMNEKPRAKCPVCGKPATRKISGGAALVFKGSGFYITDYGKDGKGPRKPESEAAPASESKPGSEAKSETGKPDARPGTKPDSAAKPASRPGKGKAASE